MEPAFKALLGGIEAHPAMIGWALALYLLWRIHVLTDRQHANAEATTKVLAQIKTFLITKFGGGGVD